MEIHQILVAASYGDAITNEALTLRKLFRDLGPSEVFTFHGPDPRLPDVLSLATYEDLPSARSGDNVLLAHASIGEEDVFQFLMHRSERLVLRYHNITPPELFERFDPQFARRLVAGRKEVTLLRPRVSLALADSHFNKNDLQALGYDNILVVPLVVDVKALTSEPDTSLLPLQMRTEGPIVTFVGRVAPNKGHGLLLQAFHILKTYLRHDAELLLVGSIHQPVYNLVLNRFIADLALPDVHITGHLSNAQLAAVYRRSTVYLCLSEHEGFGVPLLEAMAFRVPIVAWGTTAVAETVGDAGLLLDQPRPAMAAEAVARVLSDECLRGQLQKNGTARLSSYEPATTSRALLETFKTIDL